MLWYSLQNQSGRNSWQKLSWRKIHWMVRCRLRLWHSNEWWQLKGTQCKRYSEGRINRTWSVIEHEKGRDRERERTWELSKETRKLKKGDEAFDFDLSRWQLIRQINVSIRQFPKQKPQTGVWEQKRQQKKQHDLVKTSVPPTSVFCILLLWLLPHA